MARFPGPETPCCSQFRNHSHRGRERSAFANGQRSRQLENLGTRRWRGRRKLRQIAAQFPLAEIEIEMTRESLNG